MFKAPGSVENYFISALTGAEQLSEPYLFTLTVRSQGPVPPVGEWVGASITFGMGASDNTLRKINGQCVRFEQSYHKGNYVEYVVDVAPMLTITKQRRDCRIFSNLTAIDIIAQIFSENNIAFDRSKVNFVDEVREYCVQYWETDFDFCSRLMEEEGIFYFFRYQEGAGLFDHMMYLADDPSAYFDGDIFDINFFEDSHNQGLTDIDLQYMQSTASWLTHDYNYKQPRLLTPIKTSSNIDYSVKGSQYYEWPGGYDNASSGDRRSRFGIQQAEAQSVIMTGEGTYMCFMPGARFQITDKRIKPGQRKIAILSVSHKSSNPYSHDEGEYSYKQTFSAIPSQDPYHAPRDTPRAVVRGPQTAVVLDETDPDGLGRVKVRFHWDHAGTSTCWLRVAQQWAGDQIGAQWIPRIGWEVLVDFLEGDPDRPLITGGLYNGDNAQPFTTPANLSQSGWRTRTYPKGSITNEFIFEDKAGGEEIYTYAGRNYRRMVDNDEDVTIKQTLVSRIGKTETRTVGTDRTTSIGSNEALTVGAARTVKIGSSDTLTVGSDRTAQVSKNETVTIGASATRSVANDQTTSVGGSASVKVGGSGDVKVGGSGSLSVGGSGNVTVTGSASVTLEGSITIQDLGGITITTTGPFTVTSAAGITLSVGGNSISIKPGGIVISGSLVQIN